MNTQLAKSKNIDPKVIKELRQQLDRFYATAIDYTAFEQISNQRNCWEAIMPQIKDYLALGKEYVHVLEIGAGRSGFARFLAEVGYRDRVIYHAQDVTTFNDEWLTMEANQTYFGDITSCDIPMMDIIFSTYVLEHVTNPSDHLAHLWTILNKSSKISGSLFIFCPRYDLPGYLCPSARHLSKFNLAQFLLKSTWSRICTCISGKPSFLIQTDLAAFHGPFYIDSDAVHWVSLFDLKAWSRQKGAISEILKLGNPYFPSKDWFIKRCCTTAIRLQKSSL